MNDKLPQTRSLRWYFNKAAVCVLILFSIWIYWTIYSIYQNFQTDLAQMHGADRAQAELGPMIEGFVLIFFWFVGSIVLGLIIFFTRTKRNTRSESPFVQR